MPLSPALSPLVPPAFAWKLRRGKRGERESILGGPLTQGGARASLALGYYQAIPTGFQFGSLRSQEANVKVSDGSQPTVTFHSSQSATAGSGSLHRRVDLHAHALRSEPIAQRTEHLSVPRRCCGVVGAVER